MVTATDVDGEYICVKCGRVFGSVEVAGIEEIRSHSVARGVYGVKQIHKRAERLVSNLGLPDFALKTITRVANDLTNEGVTEKQAILFASLYACREHHIPRLLENILDAIREVYGTKIAESPASLLKLLNKTSRKAYELGYRIRSPDKHYYLQSYLAKIQSLVISETSMEYYEYLRARASKMIESSDSDNPSHAAKEAILSNTCRSLQLKLRRTLSEGDTDA